MTEARKIAERIGYRSIAAAVDVGTTAVSNAVVRGKFPASWFVAVSKLCSREQIECPIEAFGMRIGSLEEADTFVGMPDAPFSRSQSRDAQQTVSNCETVGADGDD